MESGYLAGRSTISARVIGDTDDFKIKGAASRPSPIHGDGAQNETKDEADDKQDLCTICLELITERAVAVPCNHLTFDYLCLVQALEQRAQCPLCNSPVIEVQYDFAAPDDYRTHKLTPPRMRPKPASPPDEVYRSRYPSRSELEVGWPNATYHEPANPVSDALSFRRSVYNSGLRAQHTGSNSISGFRDFSAADFSNELSGLQRRARTFLRRELQAFMLIETESRARNQDFLLEFIVALLKHNDIQGADGHAEDVLAEYLGREDAKRLLHELKAWLRSPYETLEQWDRNVRYDKN